MFEIIEEFRLPATNQYTSITFDDVWRKYVRERVFPNFQNYSLHWTDITFREGHIFSENEKWHFDGNVNNSGTLIIVWANSHPTHLISLETRRPVRLTLKPHQVAVFSNDDHVHRCPPNLTKVQIKGRKFGRAYLTLKSPKKVLDRQTTV